jgi:hypothetical protein
MTLQEFADTLDSKEMYIAIIPNGDYYDLEIEINHGTIGGVFSTECQTNKIGLRKVRKLADELELILVAKGIRIYRTREAWEDVEFPSLREQCSVAINQLLQPIGTDSLRTEP